MKQTSARKVLNQIIWDSRLKVEAHQLTYIHRGTPTNTKTILISLLKLHRFVFSIEETEIPYHRIIEIKNYITGEILFHRVPPKTSGV